MPLITEESAVSSALTFAVIGLYQAVKAAYHYIWTNRVPTEEFKRMSRLLTDYQNLNRQRGIELDAVFKELHTLKAEFTALLKTSADYKDENQRLREDLLELSSMLSAAESKLDTLKNPF